MNIFRSVFKARRPSHVKPSPTLDGLLRPSQEVVDSVVRENLALKREVAALKLQLAIAERRVRALLN